LVLAFILLPVVTAGGADPPETTITSGPSALTNEPRPTFTFSSTAPGSTFKCKLDRTVGPFACASPYQFPPRGDGPHVFEVFAVEPAGAADQTPASTSFTIDTVPPALRVTDHPGSTVRTSSGRATVEFAFSSGDPGATFVCARDANAAQACSSPLSLTFPLGRHQVTIRSRDAAGNESPPHSTMFSVVSPPKRPPTCSQFASQAQAQRFFAANVSKRGSGAGRLDSDHDGVACDRLGSPFVVAVSIDYNERRGFFSGTTHAADPHISFDISPVDCWEAQRIDVFEVGPGADKRVASSRIGALGRSKTTGVWRADSAGKSGRFYAKIRTGAADRRRGCLGGRSAKQRF
jgi:hypothetical protein